MSNVPAEACNRQVQACQNRFADILDLMRQQAQALQVVTSELAQQGKQNERMLAQLEEAQSQRKKLWVHTDTHIKQIAKLEQAGVSSACANAKWVKYLGFAVAVCVMVATVLICVVGVLTFLQ